MFWLLVDKCTRKDIKMAKKGDKTVSMIFAENVLKILKHDGVSIGEFEYKYWMNAGPLSRYAKGTYKGIRLDTAYEIAKELGVTVEELILTDWDNVIAEEKKAAEIEKLEEERRMIDKRLSELHN